MRTTVEITDEQHRELQKLAIERGIRGFSELVREAIEQYLEDQAEPDLEAFLALRGSLSEQEAEEWRQRIEELRKAPWHGDW